MPTPSNSRVCGFSIMQEVECSIVDMKRALARFKTELNDSEVGLFFFAGHGMQIDGENYLAAVDTDITQYIADFHNTHWLHPTFGYLSPADYEKAFA